MTSKELAEIKQRAAKVPIGHECTMLLLRDVPNLCDFAKQAVGLLREDHYRNAYLHEIEDCAICQFLERYDQEDKP